MTSATDAYLDAIRGIPAGGTRTFLEVAGLAGRSGAARAAGRVVGKCAVDGDVPWHRVVGSSGEFAADEARAEVQRERLREEDARPREDESVREWAERVGTPLVGRWSSRTFLEADDPQLDRSSPDKVEALSSVAVATRRGFHRPRTVREEPDTAEAPAEPARPAPRPLPVVSAPEPPEEEPEPVEVVEPGPLPSEDDPPPGRARRPKPAPEPLEARIAHVPASEHFAQLARMGYFHVKGLLDGAACHDVLHSGNGYERTIDMAPKGYGVGRYGYFEEPAPRIVSLLREHLFALLRPTARTWCRGTNAPRDIPERLSEYWDQCREAGQERASSIMLRYDQGGMNNPHRDEYGKHVFPFQALIVLSRRGADFDGGAFQLHEEHEDGRVTHDIVVDEGDLLVFANKARPDRDGGPAIPLRHGMAQVTAGTRFAVGIVFNLAK